SALLYSCPLPPAKLHRCTLSPGCWVPAPWPFRRHGGPSRNPFFGGEFEKSAARTAHPSDLLRLAHRISSRHRRFDRKEVNPDPERASDRCFRAVGPERGATFPQPRNNLSVARRYSPNS